MHNSDKFIDAPDRDNCDICGEDAWQIGMPVWTCDRQLFCQPCTQHRNEHRQARIVMKDIAKRILGFAND